jgi:formiminoglutamase
MTLPLLISVPHAGRWIPPEVESLVVLAEQDVIDDADAGAEEIYWPLEKRVQAFVTTKVARAVVDMNRSEENRTKDGVVKTHTSYDVPVYREPPTEAAVLRLLENYYRPYHDQLTRMADGVRLGLDCHTMAAVGPPVAPDPGVERPWICLSNADGTCPEKWINSLARCLETAFEHEVSINQPFRGGFIVRSHAREMPWMQLELSRAPFLSNAEKSECVLKALTDWCESGP